LGRGIFDRSGMKLVVCESCEAECQIKHHMDDDYYMISFCPFCGEGLEDELEHEIEWEEDDD